MTVSIAIVCEARADRDTVCTLADRVLLDAIDWIENETIEYFREWRGFLKSEPMLLWKEVHSLAQEKRIKGFGHFNGLPANPDAFVARRALLLLDRSLDRPQAILFQRDADDLPERKFGLEQAHEEFHAIFPIIIGFAITKRECWHLAGFEPVDEAEARILREIQSGIGFHPGLRSHELTAKHDQDLKSAKRVLRVLTQDNLEREEACLKQPFKLLEERGQENGLADFLKELREYLVPLFTTIR